MTEDVRAPAERSLAGRVAWVTGAGRGLGRAIAVGLSAHGARVVLTSRTEAELETTRDLIEELGGEAFVVTGSVSKRRDLETAVDRISDRWNKLDILVNNAGISPSLTPTEVLPDREWARVIDVNLSGALRSTRAAIDLMSEGSAVINMSSVHGSVGMERLAAYSASKGGIEALTRTLAMEWASRGIRVNAVAPGYFETSMTEGLRASKSWRERLLTNIPLGRFGEPHELVPAVVFLASDAASYVTGATLYVDGGWTAR